MAGGVLLRVNTFSYHGVPTQSAYNPFSVRTLGGYSGIAALYFRNQLWLHRLPYLHYRFEYPVGTGLFTWLAALPGGGIAVYLALNAIVLGLCGLITLWSIGRLPRAKPWLLALSPALAAYVVQNWDLLSIAALAVAMLLFYRRRDGWGAVALALATWTKFFPILALPVVLCARLLERGPRRAGRLRASATILVPFVLVSAAINGPFALTGSAHGGLGISPGWLYFFTFNDRRPWGGTNLWTLLYPHGLATAELNALATAVTIVGVGLVLGAMVWTSRYRGVRPSDLIVPATLACVTWFLFANKVHSPQYDLWVIALLAAAGAPLALAIAFAAADLAFFLAISLLFAQPHHAHARGWLFNHLVVPTNAVLEGLLLVIFAWGVWILLAQRRPTMSERVAIACEDAGAWDARLRRRTTAT